MPRSPSVALSLLCCLAFLQAPGPSHAEEAVEAAPLKTEICEADLRHHLGWLAADERKGRESLSEEFVEASQYVAEHFKRFGLRPQGVNGTWFQPYVIRQPVLEEGNALVVKRAGQEDMAFDVEKDWNPFSFTARKDVTAPVVFAGYGITAPERNYDDYAGIDAKGKIVIVMRRTPGWRGQRHATFVAKVQNAVRHGAVGMLLVNDPSTIQRAKGADRIAHWSAGMGMPAGSAKIPAAFITQRVAKAILGSEHEDLDAHAAALAKGEMRSCPLPDVEVHLAARLSTTKEENTRNVVGFLPGRDPVVSDEVLVIGAHLDHVGLGYYGSMGGAQAAGKIHNGADDNASGSSTLLELAAWFGEPANRPRRSMLFIAFSGEERGLLGSAHFVEHPTVALDDIVAMINLDMVGRCRDERLTVNGVGSGRGFQDTVRRFNKQYRFKINWEQQGTAPSDSTSFFRKQIPVLFFFTGLHKEYHSPADLPETINFGDMARIGNLVRDVAFDLAEREDRCEYTQPPRQARPPVLGVQLSQEAHPQGVVVQRATPGGPSAEAGIVSGDVIIKLAGEFVRDRRGLIAVLRKLKAGKPVPVLVLRDGIEKQLRVALAEAGGRRR